MPSTGHSRPDREPELLDDADGRSPSAPIERQVGIERIVISTYQSVSGTGQRAVEELRGAGPRDPRTAGAAGAGGVSAPDRIQRPAAGRDLQGRRRLHDRGAQADGRDAQDPRRSARSSGSRRPAPGCPVFVGPLAVGQRADARPRSRRRSAASCSSAAPGRARRRRARRRRLSARHRRRRPRRGARRADPARPVGTSAASTSGSSATTCARAPRPTPSRSPSCSPSATSSASPPAPQR